MLALSIRQPYAELILRGIKTAELRSRSTTIIGERFYIYASKGRGASGKGGPGLALVQQVWSRDLSTGGPPVPQWMIELAEQVKLIEPGAQGGLPTGVIVGSAVIEKCEEIRDQKSESSGRASDLASDLRPLTSLFKWHLTDVERAKKLRKPSKHPQPVWFRPF